MTKAIEHTETIDWLMEGDPAIRWQTMRDILDKPEAQWKREQRRVAKEGWGKRLLSLRDACGTWGGGIYGPKWISTNYTLLLLRDMGLPQDNPVATAGASLLVDGDIEASKLKGFAGFLARMDLCVIGMYLSLMAYFQVSDERIGEMVQHLLRQQLADGGWNCAQKCHDVHHSSLHTTINVLDGLADYADYGGKKAAALVVEPVRRAHEFILEHRLFKSDKTGQVIREAFTKFSFPPRYCWDVLRGLDHLRRMNVRDERLQDAIDLLLSKRRDDGRWKLENHHRGKEFFKLDKPGQPSRWNTLRALRILRWWNG
jgi:hypothetical protein